MLFERVIPTHQENKRQAEMGRTEPMGCEARVQCKAALGSEHLFQRVEAWFYRTLGMSIMDIFDKS